jgi:hypothetical protein
MIYLVFKIFDVEEAFWIHPENMGVLKESVWGIFPWANPGTVTLFPAKCAGNKVAVPGLVP